MLSFFFLSYLLSFFFSIYTFSFFFQAFGRSFLFLPYSSTPYHSCGNSHFSNSHGYTYVPYLAKVNFFLFFLSVHAKVADQILLIGGVGSVMSGNFLFVGKVIFPQHPVYNWICVANPR